MSHAGREKNDRIDWPTLGNDMGKYSWTHSNNGSTRSGSAWAQAPRIILALRLGPAACGVGAKITSMWTCTCIAHRVQGGVNDPPVRDGGAVARRSSAPPRYPDISGQADSRGQPAKLRRSDVGP